MTRRWLYLMLGLVAAAAFVTTGAALAEENEGKKEQELQTAVSTVDREAGEPQGEKTVVERIKKEFNVDHARVTGLRAQKLGYGEVGIALALAQKLPGGITDANVQKIMAMRQGPPVMGWGQIAHKLDLNLGHVVSAVEKVTHEPHAEVKGERGGMGRPEKPMRSERPEKPERPAGNPRRR